mgnify:CR=1 FL=1|jgi:hypothetical protein
MSDRSVSDYIFKAYVTNTQAYDTGERDVGAWLYFPPFKEHVFSLLEEIGLPPDAAPDMYFMESYVCNIEGLEQVLPMYGDIDELAALAQGLYDLPPHEYDKLEAIQSSPLRFTSLEQFREYPWNVDFYCLAKEIKDDAALGRDWFSQQLLSEIPESCKGAIDYEAFGRHVREKEKGIFTDKGYLTLSGDEWLHDKPQPRQEQKQSLKVRLKQMKKDCPDRDTKPDKTAKHGPEL